MIGIGDKFGYVTDWDEFVSHTPYIRTPIPPDVALRKESEIKIGQYSFPFIAESKCSGTIYTTHPHHTTSWLQLTRFIDDLLVEIKEPILRSYMLCVERWSQTCIINDLDRVSENTVMMERFFPTRGVSSKRDKAEIYTDLINAYLRTKANNRFRAHLSQRW